MINFYLPGFSRKEQNAINLYFIDLLKNNPEYFYDDIHIAAIYDCFLGMKWNGGRCITGDFPLAEAINTIEEYNSRNVAIRFTYTNNSLTEDLYLDKVCNLMTMLAHNGQNEIIINDNKLYYFLKNTYPNYRYISSTTKCLLDNNEIKDELDEFYLTVLDFRKNKNFKFLEELNKDKVEILLNPYCGLGCQNRLQHYTAISLSQIKNTGQIASDWMTNNCKWYCPNFLDNLKNNPAVITREELSKYIAMGFHHFKIEGRTDSPIDVVESYLYYMIKPEYINEIRYKCLKLL